MEEEEEEEEVVGRERYSTQPWDIQYNHLCRLLFREGEAFYLTIICFVEIWYDRLNRVRMVVDQTYYFESIFPLSQEPAREEQSEDSERRI